MLSSLFLHLGLTYLLSFVLLFFSFSLLCFQIYIKVGAIQQKKNERKMVTHGLTLEHRYFHSRFNVMTCHRQKRINFEKCANVKERNESPRTKRPQRIPTRKMCLTSILTHGIIIAVKLYLMCLKKREKK